MQDIQIHHAFIVKLVKSFAFVVNSVELFAGSAGNLICDVSMYVQATKLLNVKNSRNRRMSAMVVVKRHIVLCQGSFIHPSMLMMSIVASWLTAELVLIQLCSQPVYERPARSFN